MYMLYPHEKGKTSYRDEGRDFIPPKAIHFKVTEANSSNRSFYGMC